MEQSKKEGIAALLDRSKSYQQTYNPFVGKTTVSTEVDPIIDPNLQRGLEAATFATAIGQAPTTGSLLGDFFSTLGQLGPASLATLKERQSIKEKEAEYKTKVIKERKSLAEKLGKSDFLREVAVDGNRLPYDHQNERLVSQKEQMARPGDFEKIYDENKNEKLFIDNDPESENYGSPVWMPAQKAREINEEQGKTVFKVAEDEIEVYDPTASLLNSIKTMTPTAFRKQLEKNPRLTRTIPPKVRLDIEAYEKEFPIQKEEQREAKKRLAGLQGLIQIGARINKSLQEGAEGGTAGAFYLSLNEAGSFIKSAFRTVVGQSKESKAQVANELVKVEEELLNRETGLLRKFQFTKDQFPENYKELEKKRREFLDQYDKDPTLSKSVENQVFKTNLTQFAYVLAKSRESGGKFSVPDIQFAFQSAGDSSNKQRVVAGINQLITGRLTEFVPELRETFRNLETGDVASVLDLYKELPTYQSVFIKYMDVLGNPISEMTEEEKAPWIEFNDANLLFPSTDKIKQQKLKEIDDDLNFFPDNEGGKK